MNKFDVAFFSFEYDLDWVVPGLKKIIQHVPDYNKIILVWDDYIKNLPIDFDRIQEQVQHEIFVVRHSELYDWPQSIIEWGWIKQQLVKLMCYRYSNSDFTWICDSDVSVVGNPELFYNNLPCLRYDSNRPYEKEMCYVSFIEKYFKINSMFEKSFVGSTCLFDNSICKEMWEYCLQNNNQSLVECVEEFICDNPNNTHPFSEFATYGNYCYTQHSDKFYTLGHNWNYYPNGKNLNWPIQIGKPI
jgi:hypothetical protein